jgi:pilus assembly protein FimV
MMPVQSERPFYSKMSMAILRPRALAGVLLFSGAAGGVAHAAKLGPLAVFSDFGEPLRAVIEVVEVSPQLRPVSAQLASPQIYAELGVAYPASLEGAMVRLFQQPDGRWLIRIATQRIVDERDFSLVVSLTTDIGRQVRQYSLAADVAAAPGRVAAVPASAPGRNGPAGVPGGPPPVVVPSGPSPVASAPALDTKTNGPSVPAPAPAAERTPAESRPATVTVRPGDTATSIARRIKPDDLSDEQAVMALYRANERAFGGSVHRLAPGAVLRVPDGAAMREVDPRAARAALRAQPFIPASPPAEGGSGQDRLVLAGGGTGRATSERGGGGRASAATAAIAHDVAMSEANSRIRELEAIVASLRKLLALREQQIAAAQDELATLRAGARQSGAMAEAERPSPLGAATATLVRLPAKEGAAPAPTVAGSPEKDTSEGALLERLLRLPVLGAFVAVLALAGGLLWRRRRRRAAQERDPDTFTF